jgi:hypothetical protein
MVTASLLRRLMTGERVPTWLLEPGDVIRVRHHHDPRCGECLAQWETDAVVTDRPTAVCGRLAVSWAADARLHGNGAAVTGISLFEPGERALRIGRLPSSRIAHQR